MKCANRVQALQTIVLLAIIPILEHLIQPPANVNVIKDTMMFQDFRFALNVTRNVHHALIEPKIV
jgi:hypothetical protein